MLTKENYFNQENTLKYFSVSQIKDFIKCEASFFHYLNLNNKKSFNENLAVSKFFDILMQKDNEELNNFEKELLEKGESIRLKNGNLKTKYQTAQDTFERIQKDPNLEYLKNLFDYNEKQKIFTGVVGGLNFKGMLDVFVDDKSSLEYLKSESQCAIVDLKYVSENSFYDPDEYFVKITRDYDYYLQLAVYQYLVFANIGVIPDCYLYYITKGEKPLFKPLKLDNVELKKRLDSFTDFLNSKTNDGLLVGERLVSLKNTAIDFLQGKGFGVFLEYCGTCDYCREHQPNIEVRKIVNDKIVRI